MEVGECTLWAKGSAASPGSADGLELHLTGSGKRAVLQLVQTRKGSAAGGEPHALATVDKALTNKHLRPEQSRRGGASLAGQLQALLAADLVELRVLSASACEPGVVAVRAAVRLLPAAFQLVVPEHTSRALRSLDDAAAASMAAAATAAALIDVVELLERHEAAGDGLHGGGDTIWGSRAEKGSGGPGPSDNGANGAAAAAAVVAAPRLLAKANPDGDFPDDDHHDHGHGRKQAGAAEPGHAASGDVRDEVFEIVAPRDWHITHPNPPGLKCNLFRYQQRALSWMVWRETQPELGPEDAPQPPPPLPEPAFALPSAPAPNGAAASAVETVTTAATALPAVALPPSAGIGQSGGLDSEAVARAAAAAAAQHLGEFASQDLFWRRKELRNGETLWVNPFPGGGLRRTPPPPPRRQRVGILADEMGLGKTVEVIALMLARPAAVAAAGGVCSGGAGPLSDGTHASGPGETRPGGARRRGPSLIVTPPSILQQWSHEVVNHSNLKVFVYDGLRWHRQQTEQKQKQLAKDAKRQAKEAANREKEAKQLERAKRMAERAAERAAKKARSQRRGVRASAGAGARLLTTQHRRRRARNGDGSAEEGSEEDWEDGEDGEEEQGGGGGGKASNGPPGAMSGSATMDVDGAAGRHPPPANGQPTAEGWRAIGAGGAAAEAPAGARRPRLRQVRQAAVDARGAHGDTDGSDDNSGDEDYRPGTRGGSKRRAASRVYWAPAEGPAAPAGAIAAATATANAATASGNQRSTASASATAGSAAANAVNSHGLWSAGAGAGPSSAPAAAPAAAAGPSSSAGGPARAVAVPSRMELLAREWMATMYAGTAMCPASCDPEREAEAAVEDLLGADVVLTTYSVLKEEVHYSPSNRVLSGLRHEKKYQVPESPLLQVHWHRLVLDEAQMAGGSYSNVALMASRIEATHRWCVTGTPIGAGGLLDILGLLRILQYSPYDDDAVFRRLIMEPFLSGSVEGYSHLAALLKPIMWRNSKAVAALDHPLPRRTLQEVHLRLSAPEEAFYEVIRGETRKAYDELTSHQHHQRQQAVQQQQRNQNENQNREQQGQQTQEQPGQQARNASAAAFGGAGQSGSALEVVDLTAEDGEEGQQGGSASGGTQREGGSGGGSPSKQTAAHQPQHGAHGRGHQKRRREEAQGEKLANVARESLHQMRLACVHPKLTRFWQKLAAELNLAGPHVHGAGAAGAAALPAIDEMMARLRDQQQLHLQNAERDLCLSLNALAARLEATARKVKALAARRAAQEAGSPRSGGGAAVADDDAAAGGDSAGGKRRRKAAKQSEAATLRKSLAVFGEEDEDPSQQRGLARGDDGAGGGGDSGAAAAENEMSIAPYRYNSSGMTAAALAADAERMLKECSALLEYSWKVGEDGIEAAAAAEGAAAAAGDSETDIKAAAASIRSWRYVQAYTAQLLADLLTDHPHVLRCGNPTGPPNATCTNVAGPGPSCSAAPPPGVAAAAASAPDSASVTASAATVAAARARAAELRSYVDSRVTDVRATADKELGAAKERVAKMTVAIERLEKQVVEQYEAATTLGLPPNLVSEPKAWLADVYDRLEAARQAEAAHRAEQQAKAAAGATLALMGKEVTSMLSGEEAAVNRLRVGLDAAAGSLLVEEALARLRGAARGLRSHHQSLDQPGADWVMASVGGVNMLLPPEGLSSVADSDPRVGSRAAWCLSYPPAVGLLRLAVSRCAVVEPVEAAARGLTHGFDHMTALLCDRHLRHPIRMLEARLQEQHKTAENHGTRRLRDSRSNLQMLLAALEAVRLRVELLRMWREHNTAELLLEVAVHNCETVTAEVMAASQGQLPGLGPLLRQPEEDLRDHVLKLKVSCKEFRDKKTFFHNQYLEASRRRFANGLAGARTDDVQPAQRLGSAAGLDAATTTATAGGVLPVRRGPSGPALSSPDSSGGATARTPSTATAVVPLSGSSDLAALGAANRAANAVNLSLNMHTDEGVDVGVGVGFGVGVARSTGIMASLHQWSEWRHLSRGSGWGAGAGQPHRRDAAQIAASGGVTIMLGGGGGPPVDQVNLTGLDDGVMEIMEVTEAAALEAGADAAAEAVETDAAAAAAQQAAAGATVAATAAAPDAPAEVNAAATDAAARAGPRGVGADGDGGKRVGGAPVTSAATDRAAAAAAAARARIAAVAAEAAAKFGLAPDDTDHDGDDDGRPAVGALEECEVCSVPMSNIMVLPCGHFFCVACTDKLLAPTGSRQCPKCRLYIRDRDKDKILAAAAVGSAAATVRNAVGGLKPGAGSGQEDSEVDPPEGRQILSVKVHGADELMCKISALIRRLVWLRENRPAEKSLVFSQWPDALEIVEVGLKSNHIGYVKLESGRRVRSDMRAFLEDDSVRVFLLRLRQGAAGLTLVRANHVFLLEPSLDPAIEQQAVARVHRIGQTRDVTVTRLLVDGTVEEAVMRMLREKQQLFVESGGDPLKNPNRHHPLLSGPGPSTSSAATLGSAAATRRGGGGLGPCAVPLLEGGEGEEASLPAAAPRREEVTGEDVSYLLSAVLL